MDLEKSVHNSIDNLKEKAFELNDYIYNNPELAHKEFLAYQKYMELLKNEGIPVEGNFLGLATSFKATINEDKNSDIKNAIAVFFISLAIP